MLRNQAHPNALLAVDVDDRLSGKDTPAQDGGPFTGTGIVV
jgi:hypothetical protein